MSEPLPDPSQQPSDTSVRSDDGPQPGQEPGFEEVEVADADAVTAEEASS